MRFDGLHLLLSVLLIATAITAITFRRDTVEARRRHVHAERLLAIRTEQRDLARVERDLATTHAEEAQELLVLAAQDARRRHPTAGLSLVEGGDSA